MQYKAESWHQKLAELMVRQGLSIRAAAQVIGKDLGAEASELLWRRREFQKLLRLEKNRYFQEIADDPTRTKASIIGLMVHGLHKLAEEDNWKEVIEGALKLAKVEGWAGADSTVNVFANLSAKEIEEVKKRLQGELPKIKDIPALN